MENLPVLSVLDALSLSVIMKNDTLCMPLYLKYLCSLQINTTNRSLFLAEGGHLAGKIA